MPVPKPQKSEKPEKPQEPEKPQKPETCETCQQRLTPSGVRRGWTLCDTCRAEARRLERTKRESGGV